MNDTFESFFQDPTPVEPVAAKKPRLVIAKKRKAGAGRKQVYTSKCVPFTSSIPAEAIEEVKLFITAVRNKYKK